MSDTATTSGAMPEKYDFSTIERHWQDVWEQRATFAAPDGDPREKLYVLQMFPYPSGHLHAGHIRNYVLGDAIARFWRMKGYNVMHPMGFDSFGLPAEQAAIDREIQPSEWIDQCVAAAKQQFKSYGFSFDWNREVVTSSPEYYRWTQWLFLKFHELGLVYRKQIEVNWCGEHGVLANDEVKEGTCWRCDQPVKKQKMEQWCMRTTDYAQRLLDGLDKIPGWTDSVRTMQRNWLGRSEGTNIVFKIPALEGELQRDDSNGGAGLRARQSGSGDQEDGGRGGPPHQGGLPPADSRQPELTVFTTRVDTIFGCTFMAIAPDHPLAAAIADKGHTAEKLEQFAAECARENVRYTVAEEKPKRGIYLGVDCVNPFNEEPIQIWATNYVVSDFGTGAVMAVPAHDTRDHAFALEYGLPIRQVIEPDDDGQGRPPSREEDDGKTPADGTGAHELTAGAPASLRADSGGLEITKRRLPHWKLAGAAYSVSWRLAPGQPDLLPEARTLVAEAIQHFAGERYHLFGYVVMNDHVHLIVQPFDGVELSELMHSWRSFTANKLQRGYGYKGAVWQDDYYDRIIRNTDEFWETMEYIVTNPVKRWPDHRDYEWLYWADPEQVIAGSEALASPQEDNGGQGRPSSGDYKEISCYTEKGVCINSGGFDGLSFAKAKAAMDQWLEARGLGGKAVEWRLRDWNMSRQRFWGAPIPMVHCESCGWQRVPDDELPVKLPGTADYSDFRVSPLANDKQWQQATCPGCGGDARRETDTMTTFMCSAWYFLRYCDPLNSRAPFDRAKVEAWMPVDYYIGGKEHAVGHLLYSRFITQVLHDAQLLDLTKGDHDGGKPAPLHDEPFRRLFNQGIVYKDGAKMSKSKGNVVSADELAENFGADTARLFAFFGGPADQDLEWTTSGVEGCSRFLRRIWRLAREVQQSGGGDIDHCDKRCQAVVRATHAAIAGVSDDVAGWRFNTAIAKLMELLNTLEKQWADGGRHDHGGAFTNALEHMAQLLSPFAPHIAEELWAQFNCGGLCCDSDWPIHDPELLVEQTVELPVQVNGKLRGRISVDKDAAKDDVLAQAKGDEQVAKWLEGKQLVKEIYVPGRNGDAGGEVARLLLLPDDHTGVGLVVAGHAEVALPLSLERVLVVGPGVDPLLEVRPLEQRRHLGELLAVVPDLLPGDGHDRPGADDAVPAHEVDERPRGRLVLGAGSARHPCPCRGRDKPAQYGQPAQRADYPMRARWLLTPPDGGQHFLQRRALRAGVGHVGVNHLAVLADDKERRQRQLERLALHVLSSDILAGLFEQLGELRRHLVADAVSVQHLVAYVAEHGVLQPLLSGYLVQQRAFLRRDAHHARALSAEGGQVFLHDVQRQVAKWAPAAAEREQHHRPVRQQRLQRHLRAVRRGKREHGRVAANRDGVIRQPGRADLVHLGVQPGQQVRFHVLLLPLCDFRQPLRQRALARGLRFVITAASFRVVVHPRRGQGTVVRVCIRRGVCGGCARAVRADHLAAATVLRRATRQQHKRRRDHECQCSKPACHSVHLN